MKSSMMRVMQAVAMSTAVLVSACSSGALGDFSPKRLVGGAPDPEADKAALERFAPVAVCPEIEVRDGTQLLRVFDKGKDGDPNAIRFQAAIRKYARECHTDAASGVTTIKVGVYGRMLAGPSGATGSARLPLRVAMVRNGDEILYSQISETEANIAPGTAATDWNLVVDGITVPGDKTTGNFVIYIGFDDSKPAAKKGKS